MRLPRSRRGGARAWHVASGRTVATLAWYGAWRSGGAGPLTDERAERVTGAKAAAAPKVRARMMAENFIVMDLRGEAGRDARQERQRGQLIKCYVVIGECSGGHTGAPGARGEATAASGCPPAAGRGSLAVAFAGRAARRGDHGDSAGRRVAARRGRRPSESDRWPRGLDSAIDGLASARAGPDGGAAPVA